jgi:hypothetical protein
MTIVSEPLMVSGLLLRPALLPPPACCRSPPPHAARKRERVSVETIRATSFMAETIGDGCEVGWKGM